MYFCNLFVIILYFIYMCVWSHSFAIIKQDFCLVRTSIYGLLQGNTFAWRYTVYIYRYAAVFSFACTSKL